MIWFSIRVRDMRLNTSNLFTGCYYYSMSLSVALAPSQLLQRFVVSSCFHRRTPCCFSSLKTRRRNASVMCSTHVTAGTLAVSAVVHIPPAMLSVVPLRCKRDVLLLL